MRNIYEINWKSKEKTGKERIWGNNSDQAKRDFYRLKKSNKVAPTARIRSIKKL